MLARMWTGVSRAHTQTIPIAILTATHEKMGPCFDDEKFAVSFQIVDLAFAGIIVVGARRR